MTNKQKEEIAAYYAQPHTVVIRDYVVKTLPSKPCFYIYLKNPITGLGIDYDIKAQDRGQAWEIFKQKIKK